MQVGGEQSESSALVRAAGALCLKRMVPGEVRVTRAELLGAIGFSYPRSRRRLSRRLRAALTLILVLFLALEGIPATIAPAAAAAAPSGPSPVHTSGASTNVSVAQVESVPSQAAMSGALSGAQLASLCLLDVLPKCATSANSGPAPAALDPPSSWTNLTNLSSPTPAMRQSPAMVFSPADHGDVLFGGYQPLASAPYWVFYQDTWLMSGKTWSELVANSSCTPSTCPAGRAGAMLAPLGTSGVLLFGGYNYTPNLGGPVIHAFGDTWLFSGGKWTNLTASVGTAPAARFFGTLAYDSLDNLVVLFGGEAASGITFGDTWEFAGGAWTNVTATVGSVSLGTAPEARAGAAVAASPDGHVMMFGGEDQGTIISNYCANGTYASVGLSAIAWWFYAGHWVREANYGGTFCPPLIHQQTIAPLATATMDPPNVGPPCGRIFAALGWSKNNNRFALYGGYGLTGAPLSSLYGVCSGPQAYLNDTFTYAEPPGGGFDWFNVTDAGDPIARARTGSAGDLSNGFFVIFGGTQGTTGLAETWRFFELVHARLTGPATIDLSGAQSFLLPFVVTGFGGSSDLSFTITLTELKTHHWLVGSGDCAYLTNNASDPVPYDGVVTFFCTPTAQSYNVFRATLEVVDTQNSSDAAFSNWTFTVLPPEAIQVYSQYVTYFYVGFSFQNKFTVFTEVLNSPAVTLTATMGGLPLGFVQRTGDARYWDAANVEMAHVSPGSVLSVTADFGDWTLNATYKIHMIDTPDWLQTIYAFPYGDKSTDTKGAGPYNQTYSVSDTYEWNLGDLFNFSIPVPLVSGNYSLVPTVSIAFGWTSTGNVSLTGTFSFQTPKISLGVFDLKITAALSMKGTFALDLQGPEIAGITWLAADAKITITGDFSASIPIYGFSFDLLGQNISIGFTLNLDIKPSVALDMLLAPTNQQPQELIDGIGVMMKQLIGSFKLPLQAAVQFSIGIASVQFGGTLGLALAFNITPSFSVTGGSVTGDIFVGASFLFWSGQWDLVGPGTIYSWGTGAKLLSRGSPSAYNSGSGVVWVLRPRYYDVPGYDANVWNATVSEGTAISNLYPEADPVAAAASNGAYVFTTDDRVSLPVNQGLTVSGFRLDADTNTLKAIPSPPDPGYLIARPQATTLANGSLFVVWDALPMSETSVAGPQDVSTIALHGARYDPTNGTWGAVVDFTSTGVAQSYQVDPTGGTGRVVALVTDGPAVGQTTPEHLMQFDAATGAQLSSANVSGYASVVMSRAAAYGAVVTDLGGNRSLVRLSDGAPVAVPYAPSARAGLLSEAFVAGSSSQLLLLYRDVDRSEAVLVDLATNRMVLNLPLDGNVSDLEGIASGATTYLFAATPGGILVWQETGGSAANLTTVAVSGVHSFGVVQEGSSILLYALTQTGGNESAPIRSLQFAELGAALPLVPSVPAAAAPVAPAALSIANLLLLAALGVVDAVLLAVVVLRKRQGKSPPLADPSEPGTPPTEPPADATHQPPQGGPER